MSMTLVTLVLAALVAATSRRRPVIHRVRARAPRPARRAPSH
jgi:hypothetical protein